MKKSFNILVSDRNPNVRRLLHREITALGYRVTLAKNGKDVMESLTHNRIDLVILDPELVDLSGSSFIKQFKSKVAALPVIIHTFSNGKNRYDDICEKNLFIEKGSSSVEIIKEEAHRILGG